MYVDHASDLAAGAAGGLDDRIPMEAVFCGAYHSFVLTKHGNVYSFGLNNMGQLGLGSLEPNHTGEPTLVEALEGVGVVETVQLLWGTPVAFWVIVGPAIMTAGGVWRRITGPERGINGDDGSGAKFEEDFLVERLGGAEPVRKLRASVSAALTVEAKPLPEWQRNMGATGKK